MEEDHHLREATLSSPITVLTSSPFSMSNSSSTEAAHSITVFNPPASIGDNTAFQKLSSNIHSLIAPDSGNIFSDVDIFSDVLVYVSDRAVPLHRCVLAVRCPFFMSLFSQDMTYLESLAPVGRTDTESTKLRIDLGQLLDKCPNTGRVGYDAFMVTIGFLYSGKQTIPDVKCIDDQCLHEACRPVVDFAVEMLCLSSVLNITDLKAFWQHHLHNIIEKAQVDEVLPVLVAAKVHGAVSLLSLSKHLVAISNMGSVDLEKQLPLALADEVLVLRCKMGLLQPETLNPTHEKECQRIRKALDSDDVELVQLLLKEGRVSLDGAHGLHYAVSYCDPHTVKDILELGLADVNLRNDRGFTVLHVASMRCDPSILVALLSKGAKPFETTPDGRTALQLCSRLMRRSNNESNAEAAEELRKECLSVEILYQAGMKNLFEDATFSPAVDEKELLMRLLYLENRVAVARLLFPQEVKLVTGISDLESTSEFTGLGVSDLSNMWKREANVDLNQTPLNHVPINQVPIVSSSTLIPVMNEALVKRVEALHRTVIIGRRMFPRCTAILNSFTDDDPSELSCIEMGSPSEEQAMKKRRYCELKELLAEAFQKDVAERRKSGRSDRQRSSSSSS